MICVDSKQGRQVHMTVPASQGEVGMEVQKRAQIRAVHVVIIGIIRYLTSLLLFTEIPLLEKQ